MAQALNLDLKAIILKTVFFTVVVLLALLAAKQIFDAVRAPKSIEFYHQPLAKLMPVIAGEQINVPKEYGIFSTKVNEGTILIAGADKVGKSAFVDLCVQKTKSKEFPNKIFPLYVLSHWGSLSTIKNTNPRTPIILGAEVDDNFPKLVITGVVQPIQNHANDLKLTSLSNSKQMQIIFDQGQRFDQDAWLVWNKTIETDTNTYQSALHIKRVLSSSCDAGQLEFELLQTKQGLIPQDKKVQLWVFSNNHQAETVWLNSGTHQVPSTVSKTEDQALFEAAVENGLIQLNKQNSILIAPQDLFVAIEMGKQPVGWEKVVLNEQNQAILKRLYQKSDGDYVRQIIKNFNQKAQWAAFRVKKTNGNIGHWNARVEGYYATLTPGMPEVIASTYAEPPLGWGQWMQVTMPETHVEAVSINLMPTINLPSLEVELLGDFLKATGVQSAQENRVCSAKACADSTNKQILLKGIQAGKMVEIKLKPNIEFAKLAKSAAEFNPIFVQNNQLRWRVSPKSQPNMVQSANVSITDRNGFSLFENNKPTDQAKSANLSTLLGLSSTHTNALSGIFARLGEHGYKQVNAKLSIDTRMQNLAQNVVNCIGINGFKFESASGECTTQSIVLNKEQNKSHSEYVKTRHAGLLVMDAGTGEILAAAGDPLNPDQFMEKDIFAYDRFKPDTSPLKVRNWQHSGNVEQAPGSTFKLVTALALEDYAKTHPSVVSLLDGQNVAQISALAHARGDTFDLQSACYPSPCSNQSAKVTNYREHTPVTYTQNGVFGLRQALSFSINTWFAWLAEQTDTTLLFGKHQLVQNLDTNALDNQRPITKLAHQLGFSSAIKLDAGLMPSTFKWQAEDALHTTASNFDPIYDQHNVRQQAIGLRAQVTPLQMSMVAASIGEGKFVKPHLLMQLNESYAPPSSFAEMDIPLTRIRAGMKDVVETGTAAFVFSESKQQFKNGIYAKTGTAPMQHLGEHMNTAWFVGYIEPNTIQSETRRLAFAAWVTHTPLTGGEHAAPMLASFVEQLNQANKSIH